MFRSQKGFTLLGLITRVIIILWLCGIGTLCYVAWHFITKFW